MTLNKEENDSIKKLLGGKCSSLTTTVARLYLCTPDSNDWAYSNIQGGVCLVVDRSQACKPKFIHIYSLDAHPKLLWSQELYEDFKFEQLSSFFYAFEIDGAVAALSFCDPAKAKTFATKVGSNVPEGSAGKHSRSKSQSDSSPKVGWFSRMKNFLMGDYDDELEEISVPANFVHRQHIGYDPEKGFEVRDIPDQWKGLFKKVGIKKRDLKNPETAKIIFNTVQTEMNKKAPPPPTPQKAPIPTRGKQVPIPKTTAPTTKTNVPPPPILNTGGDTGGKPSVPPPPILNLGGDTSGKPPVPPMMGERKAPPLPPPSLETKTTADIDDDEVGYEDDEEAGEDQQQDHLSAIRQGVKLRAVTKKAPNEKEAQKSLPDLGNESEQLDMQEALRRAMASRRIEVKSDDEADNDDWSD